MKEQQKDLPLTIDELSKEQQMLEGEINIDYDEYLKIKDYIELKETRSKDPILNIQEKSKTKMLAHQSRTLSQAQLYRKRINEYKVSKYAGLKFSTEKYKADLGYEEMKDMKNRGNPTMSSFGKKLVQQ